MKLFEVFNKDWGKAFYRISAAIRGYSPNWVEWVDSPDKADRSLVHVVGGGEVPYLNAGGKQSIIVQHCYNTASPDVFNYPGYWEKALITISFHNLPDYTAKKFNFYRMPWGYNENLFYEYNPNKTRTAFTTGHVEKTEHIFDVYSACVKTKRILIHTGEDFKWGAFYKYTPYMNDFDYREVLNRAEYVTGLRDIEGFEMACIEGAACGAKPVVPNISTYDFYKDFAEMINMKENIVDQLVEIFSSSPMPFTTTQTNKIQAFSWSNLIPKMFNEIQKYL